MYIYVVYILFFPGIILGWERAPPDKKLGSRIAISWSFLSFTGSTPAWPVLT